MQYEYEMFFDDTSPVSIHGWWPIATDRIKDQSKIQEYIDKGILRRIDMKEQDAAHSFEKKTPSWYTADEMYHWLIREKYSEVIAKELCQKWSEDLQGAFNKGYEKSVKELTRLRSELQEEKDKKTESYWRSQFSFLQRDYDELKKKLKSKLQQERDKAKNQAIQDCIEIFKDEFSLSGEDVDSEDWVLTKKLEQLKTKP